MIEQNVLRDLIPQALRTMDMEWPHGRISGKVRETFLLPDDRRILVTTDRLSAFDSILAALPYKGQVLNQLSAFWFEKTADLIPNHLIDIPDPNISLVQECKTLPVEVVVRGFITGVTQTSLWMLYEAGEREVYGHQLPDGLLKNDPLPQPIITPTTKGGPGEHDERLTCAEVIEHNLMAEETWETIQEAALAIFRRGQKIAQAAGFVLVDTKYEFGQAPDGTIMLIDEVHTPDSSRFWQESTYHGNPENWDKEYVRLWYVARGYRGDGEPPVLPDDVVAEAAWRYITLYEKLTGQTFEPADQPAGPRIVRKLQELYQ